MSPSLSTSIGCLYCGALNAWGAAVCVNCGLPLGHPVGSYPDDLDALGAASYYDEKTAQEREEEESTK